jgi:predicted nucleotidyltransferase
MTTRAEYAERLAQALQDIVTKLSALEGVVRISLFGSYARGRADLSTDLDVLVIMDTDMGFIERMAWLYRMLAVPVDMDLICYTPAEFEALKDRPFLRHVLREEVVLYEKKPSR